MSIGKFWPEFRRWSAIQGEILADEKCWTPSNLAEMEITYF
jgi:hypothetical protein